MNVRPFWIGELNLDQKIHIIGGGISGLLAGYYFQKKGLNFEVHEMDSRIGGKLQSTWSQYGLVEHSANSILMTSKLEKFFKELNLNPIPTKKKLKRFIYRKNSLKTFPFLNIIELLKISPNFFKKTPTDISELSVFDFWKDCFGEEYTSEIFTPALHGIYSISSDQLLFKDIFSTDFNFGASYLSYFKHLKSKISGHKSISFANGMNELPLAIYEKIKENVKLNSKITEFPKNSLICIDSRYLFQKGNTSIFSTTIFLQEPIDKLLESFGVLFDKNSPILGILCNHQIFNRKSSPSYTIMSKAKIEISDIKDLFLKLFNQKINILDLHTHPWIDGLPIYGKQRHLELLKLDFENKAYFGNYIDGISLRALIEKTLI